MCDDRRTGLLNIVNHRGIGEQLVNMEAERVVKGETMNVHIVQF